jgi:septum formation protein
MTRPPLILASTSRYRSALLGRLHVPFEVASPSWAEIRLADPSETAIANARGKARSVADSIPGSAVLGSDQVGWCDGRLLEKPETFTAACEQISFLSGREHELHTAVTLRMPDGREQTDCVIARLRIRTLAPERIASYVDLDSPLDCAGSYRIESLGISLFEYVRCDDPTAIEGLPLIATTRILEASGWMIPEGKR